MTTREYRDEARRLEKELRARDLRIVELERRVSHMLKACAYAISDFESVRDVGVGTKPPTLAGHFSEDERREADRASWRRSKRRAKLKAAA